MTAVGADRSATAAPRVPISRGPFRWVLAALAIPALAVVGVAGSYGAYCGAIVVEGNFRAVQPGVIYRSAQLRPRELELFGRRYGIKSVLNLRGANPGRAWYDGEIAAARDLDMAHYDYRLSAKRVVTPRQIAQILAIVRRAPKPLLIHCASGADRSGLVAALYDYAIRGESAAEADRQLSLAYGHFPYLTSRTGAMDRSFWAFVRAPASAARD
jgi:protein tyrosine/serine phosphatase